MAAAGRLVTLEGIDGAGKSLQAAELARRFEAEGVTTVLTREPGGGDDGQPIRELVAGNSAGNYSPETEILLFTAARRNHLDKLILPALSEGKLVLSDRFVDSTRVYQGLGQPELRSLIDRLHEEFIGIEADLTLILDVPIDSALNRIRQRSGSDRRFEQFGDRTAALRNGFAGLVREFPARCRLIDGNRPPRIVNEEIFRLTQEIVA